MFTPQELKDISSLINLAPITGKDALVVAVLQQKITSIIAESTKGAEIGGEVVKNE